MKRLNKKGFTLVELLAVIVILAILIVVVATTAIPAMNNAKKSALKTYAQRVLEQTKTYYTTQCVLSNGDNCKSVSSWTLTTVMGDDADKGQYSLEITSINESAGVVSVTGSVTDVKNGFVAEITNSIVSDPIPAEKEGEETKTAEETCNAIKDSDNCKKTTGCDWNSEKEDGKKCYSKA